MTVEDVQAAIIALQQEGIAEPSANAVFHRLGGHRATVLKFHRLWKEATQEGTTVAVADAPAATPAVLPAPALAPAIARVPVVPAPVQSARTAAPIIVRPPAGEGSAMAQARQRYHAACAAATVAHRKAEPLKHAIAELEGRIKRLETLRDSVVTVEEFRAAKAALVEAQEELEIATRVHTPLAREAQLRSQGIKRAEDAYMTVVHDARQQLDRCRQHWLHGTDAGMKQRSLDRLRALIGEDEVERYVLKLVDAAQIREERFQPHWYHSLHVERS